ncbi:MAG: MFS transporter [Firmicutes bacterium]|nr:MFS transporter [Alicyclobacillaceae bacterium]MCL6498353.1 MFS transporter [Bacillota bacterium]
MGQDVAGTVSTPADFLDELPMTRFHWLLVLGVVLAQILDGYSATANSFVLPEVIRRFALSPIQAGTLASVTNFGLLIGALGFAILADRMGRRAIFQLVLLTYAFGGLISAVAPTYAVLLGGRFVAGLGIGAEFPVAFALLAEYSPKRYRAWLIALGPLCYGLGYVLAGVLALAVVPFWGWRGLFWISVAPALVIVYIRRFIPESVRYLLSKGHRDEATAILEHVARAARRPLPVLTLNAEPTASAPAIGLSAAFRRSFRYLLALSLLYFLFFIQTFGNTAWLPTLFVKAGYSVMHSFTFTLIVFSALPCAEALGGWLQDVIPRRWAIVALGVFGAVFFILFGQAFQHRWPTPWTVAADVLSVLTANGVIAILYTLGTELFPTRIRSTAMGIVTAVGRIGAIVGPLLVGALLQLGTPIPTMINVVATPLLLGALVALILIPIDTRRRGLDQIERQEFGGAVSP